MGAVVAAVALLVPLIPATGRNNDEPGMLQLTVVGTVGILLSLLLAGAAGPRYATRALGALCLLITAAGMVGHAARNAAEPLGPDEAPIACLMPTATARHCRLVARVRRHGRRWRRPP